MRLPKAFYPLHDTVVATFPHLEPCQLRQLTLWVAGTLAAGSGCEAAVVVALSEALADDDGETLILDNTLRQHLRSFLQDPSEKRQLSGSALAVTPCFAPLLQRVLRLLSGTRLALAIDATNYQDRFIAIVISVVYRSRAIPVAWDIRTAHTKGEWMPVIIDLLAQLAPVVPQSEAVIVLADEGLFSPPLFRAVQALGWAPLLRGHLDTNVTTAAAGRQCAARKLVAGPGHAWVGRVMLFKTRNRQFRATLLVVWGDGHETPWVLITALAPRDVGVCWYGLRAWIECGFRDLKALGWQWERTQRQDATRVARHWLVLALATLEALAAGTVAEEATRQRVPRALVQPPPLPPPPQTGKRTSSVFQRGWHCLRSHLGHGTWPTQTWLVYEAWPEPPPGMHLTYADDHAPTPDAPYTALPR